MKTRYATLVKHVFKPGVQLPAGGLLLRYERARLAALMMALFRIVANPEKTELPPLPYEMIVEIVREVILTTPNYGMDPVYLFRWFWNQDTSFEMQKRKVDPHPESAVERKRWKNGDKHPNYIWDDINQYGLKDKPKDDDRSLLEPPEISWKDLSMVFINYIAGSSMVHRMIDDENEGMEGTAKWYPGDIDIWVGCETTCFMFERWLFATFRNVVSKNERLYKHPEFHRIKRISRWTCGLMDFNVINNRANDLSRFDCRPAITHTFPPFNAVHASFEPTGPFVMYQIVPILEKMEKYWGELIVDGISQERLDEMRQRSFGRVEKYRRRIKNLEVIPDYVGKYNCIY